MSASNDDFLAFSDAPVNASAESTGGNNGNNKKFNPYFRKQNNQFNNWNRNQRDSNDRNFSPNRFNNDRQNAHHGQQRRFNNYNNQGGGGGNRQYGRNNQFQRHNNGNNRKPGHGQGNFGNANSAAAYYHSSMIEDPWKDCYKFQVNRFDKNSQPLNEEDGTHQNDENCIDAETPPNDNISETAPNDNIAENSDDIIDDVPISEAVESLESASG